MQKQTGPWKKELDDLARAFSGAFLFGAPLLYTMEMWWIGEYAELWKLFLFLVLAFVANLMLAYFVGFKEETSLWANISQAIEAVAVGAVASTVVLLVLNRIEPSDPLDSILGKIIIQTVPLSIGASAANAILGNGKSEFDTKEQKARSPLQAALFDLGGTVAGGMLIGFSVAPTEEIPMLAAEITYWHELALIGLTLILTYILVFASGFSHQSGGKSRGPFQHPITETILSYVVALALAFAILFLFDQIEFGDPLSDVVSQTLVLGLPTAIGGAAGRALL